MDKLQRLEEQKRQIEARIQREKARASAKDRKERTARLVAWGVVVEQMLQAGEMDRDRLAALCRRHLAGHTLARAFTGPLEGADAAPGASDSPAAGTPQAAA